MDAAQHPQLYKDLCAEYKWLGKGIIFDLAASKCLGEMALTYMIPGPRINWLWCACCLPAFLLEPSSWLKS